MRLLVTISEEEQEAIKVLSKALYQKENVSGYIVKVLRDHLSSVQEDIQPKTLEEFSNRMLGSGISNGEIEIFIPNRKTGTKLNTPKYPSGTDMPKWKLDAEQRIKRKPVQEVIIQSKEVVSKAQELQEMADRLKEHGSK